jgi:site-specific DNA recombinase
VAGSAAGGLLLAAIADPDRGFDAVVVGEYERAFHAVRCCRSCNIMTCSCGCREAHGPVDPAEVAHRALRMLLGAQSKREVLRTRSRALVVMRAQIP